MTTTSEIRTRFLKYFESKGHTIVESSPLVPQNDPTLLFANAGMNQFKDVFLGKDPRPYTRATTAQKCVRAGGKHNDLENVGFTARHHTFFEMLGNFSFGDYFKKDAIRFAWEFVTQELKLPTDRLYVTVFETDEEAAEIWHRQEGVPKDRIYRFGEKDNFWSMGETGPCGPCSEIFIDRGAHYSCGKPTCGMGCDCDRYMEFWNLVFMQYNRDASGSMTPLPKPSVDTGAGLERISMILQGVDTNYDTDGFAEILQKTATLAGRPYDPKDESVFSFRVVADHSRATAFLIGDGVMPSNEGRGYVLRRIMRRSIRHGKKLGFTGPFLHKTAGYVIDQMKGAYPDLVEKRTFIERAVMAEEEQFFRTLEKGLALLDEEVAKLGDSKTLPGEVSFKLYDTYGFPLDLTRVICEEKGIALDNAGFESAMERQRAESRKHWKGAGGATLDAVYLKLAADLNAQASAQKFVGYDRLEAQSECLALLKADAAGLHPIDFFTASGLDQSADSTERAITLEAVFAETPFYGESGGQVGDRGRVRSINGGASHFEAEVIDVQKPVDGLIVAHLRPIRGTIKRGDRYEQETDAKIRALTARNHTATHLLHWALREVLGKHVKQAGSTVNSELLRFDFSHFQAVSEDELNQIENLINERIWRAYPVSKQEMSKDQAIAAGAIAMFGEKYGNRVRVISVGDFSVELCGGTHVNNSSEIHLFKIVSEGGIAAGVRRIIAQTSQGAFNTLRTKDQDLKRVRDRFKAISTDDILARIERMTDTEKSLRKQIEQFQAQSAWQEINVMSSRAPTLANGTTKLIAGVCAPDPQGMKRLREMADLIKQKFANSVIVLGVDDTQGKANLIVTLGTEAMALKAAHAGELLKQIVGIIDGKGGGKPDLAQAGGTLASALPDAIAAARRALGING